jgi:hypothetical protein
MADKKPAQARTPEQIAAEVAALKEVKPYVRRLSFFGDNNHDAIDAQVHVLETLPTEEVIYKLYEPLDEHGEPEEEGEGQNVLDEALAARGWLDSEKVQAPSAGWRELDVRTERAVKPTSTKSKGANRRMKKD